MSCEYCTDPDGLPCCPYYGVAPHRHDLSEALYPLGSTRLLPREEWPTNFKEDPDCPGCGTYWCAQCGDGKPEETKP